MIFLFFLIGVIVAVSANVNVTRPLEYPIDTAKVYVNVSNKLPEPVMIHGTSANCYLCKRLPLSEEWFVDVTSPSSDDLVVLDAGSCVGNFPMHFSLVNKRGEAVFNFTKDLGDRGVYTLTLSSVGAENNQWGVALATNLVPLDPATPLLIAVAVYTSAAILFLIGQFLFRRWCGRPSAEAVSSLNVNTVSTVPKDSSKRPANRIAALDALRGLSIIVMMFVNYGGGGYWFTSHSRWNGLTIADLVFPWFIFIMGVSAGITLDKRRRRGWSSGGRLSQLVQVTRRSITLFCLGLFLNNGYHLVDWRIPGVLQRFGVAYFVVSLFILFVPKASSDVSSLPGGYSSISAAGNRVPLFDFASDFGPYWLEWAFAVAIFSVWFFVSFFLPVPGCPTGYLGPGGIGDHGLYPNCTGGAAGWIDRQVFGAQHLYQTPTCQKLYHTRAYDPEGLLGYATTVFICYLGLHSGRLIVSTNRSARALIARWMLYGFVLAGAGGALCQFRQNGGFIPLNKNLWSPSFILVMAGTGNMLLALFYFLIDHLKLWNGSPLRFVGMNSILLYMSHELLNPYFPFSYDWANTHGGELLSNLVGVTSWVCIAYYLFTKNVFISV